MGKQGQGGRGAHLDSPNLLSFSLKFHTPWAFGRSRECASSEQFVFHGAFASITPLFLLPFPGPLWLAPELPVYVVRGLEGMGQAEGPCPLVALSANTHPDAPAELLTSLVAPPQHDTSDSISLPPSYSAPRGPGWSGRERLWKSRRHNSGKSGTL